MTNEEAKKFANCLKNNYTIDFNDMADFCDTVIKALEQETVSKEVYDNEHFARKEAEQKLWELQQNVSDDCVSRAEVIKVLDNHWLSGSCSRRIIDEQIDKVKALPPVTPTFPKGATNGDMIKAMFPDCKDWKAKLEDNDGEVYEVHFVQLPNSLTVNKYEESWWNAPYTEMRDSKNGL